MVVGKHPEAWLERTSNALKNSIDIEGLPAIYRNNHPRFACAYYGGPWLPQYNINDCIHYCFGLDYPLQILEIPERRERLINTLLSLSSQERSLFATDGREDLQARLDRMLELKAEGRPLHKIWHKPKSNGRTRQISVPQEPLDNLLRHNILPILMRAPCHPCAHGGEKGWTVKTSLQTHLPIGAAISFDLENAFGNTHFQYVFDFYFDLIPKLRPETDPEARMDCAGFLSTISTVSYRFDVDALPQGSPISPALFNRILYPVDKLMHEAAAKRGIRYSRWVDDVVLSARETNRTPKSFLGALRLLRNDFPISVDKVYFQQGKPEFYLLGHKILGNLVFPVSEDESKNSGDRISPVEYFNEFELNDPTNHDDWVPLEDLDWAPPIPVKKPRFGKKPKQKDEDEEFLF